MTMEDLPTTDNNGEPTQCKESGPDYPAPPTSHRDLSHEKPIKNSLHLRGSGSYPTMIRARTANRNKITKRTSDSMIITGHHHHGTVCSSGSGGGNMGVGAGISDGATRSTSSKKKKLLNNKRSVYSKASRRKSLENLGLLVRNRCGTAKLQWPSEKKETDVFDLLPEGCIQVRKLIRLKSRGGGTYTVGGSGDNQCRYYVERPRQEEGQVVEDGRDSDEQDENNDNIRKGSLASEAKLKFQGRHAGEQQASPSKTDWKSRRNISVIVRMRPKQDKELVEKSIVFRTDSKTIVFDPKEKTKDFYFQGVKQLTRNDFGRKRPNRNVSFQYDKVYGPEATNKEIFEEMLQDLTSHLLEGYNSTVFAYGATGSGKTYTMIGSNSNPGLTVLMVESLYKRLEELADDYDCEVVCSYLEVYNETIKDLLRPEKELSIREDGKKGIIISELSFYKPRGPQELLKLLRSGNRARTQHATDLNAESSRSHAVFEVKLCLKRKRSKRCQQKEEREKYDEEQAENIKNEEENKDEEDGGGGGGGGDCGESDVDDELQHGGINKVEVIQSKLVMVDLAGSERGTAATSTSSGVFSDGARQREGASINKSLLALASCISALADGKCHVPYRNSKLTRLLKDSLNGLCTTVMIANISPSALTSEDTYNTLKYADRAKCIVGPAQKQKNIFMEDLVVEDCVKTQMGELRVKNVQLQEQLEEERLKRELILKELEELQRKNVEMKSEAAGSKKRNAGESCEERMAGKGSGRKCVAGECKVDSGKENNDSKEFCFAGTNGTDALTEDQLPSQIQEYIEIMRERARVFAEYVEFASENRLAEWAISCKKLKADMADFLGRLPVEDENYIWFSRLKNEVNNSKIEAFRNGSSLSSSGEIGLHHHHHHHKKYTRKLKKLTEKLEIIRQDGVKNNLLYPEPNSANPEEEEDEEMQRRQKMVAIPLEEFIELKRLASEHEGNERMEQFYQQFCQRINNQLMTSGVTLMNALKLVRNVHLHLHQEEKSTEATTAFTKGQEKGIRTLPGLQQEYKELLDLVYGPDSSSPAFPKAAQTEDPAVDHNNNHIISSSSVNKDNLLEPLSTLIPQVAPKSSNLGRKSSPVMDDLASMRKLVERPLLLQLTALLDEDEDNEEDFNAKEKQEQERMHGTNISRFVASSTATIRKSLSTAHTIYESPQAPPGTRAMRGGESFPELPLSSHHHHHHDRSRGTCVEEGEHGEEEVEEMRYNGDDEHVEDNDHHFLHPLVDTDNDYDLPSNSQRNGRLQGEKLNMGTANEETGDRKEAVWNSCPKTTTTDGCNLLNPVKRKSSTSFEIIFHRKNENLKGKTNSYVKGCGMRAQNPSPCGPTVVSALSRQKLSESQLNGSESQNEEWTTTTADSSSSVATATSACTSAENVAMMKVDNTSPAPRLQKNSMGDTTRLGNQALIKDCHHHHNHPYRPSDPHRQTKQLLLGTEENDNKSCGGEGDYERGNPSSYIYQLDSLPSPSSPCANVLHDSRETADNKTSRFRKNRDDGNLSCGESKSKTSSKVKNWSLANTSSSTKNNKTEVKREFCSSSTTNEAGNNKVNTSSIGPHHHYQNPNPPRQRGQVKQQLKEEKKGGESKSDIGSCSKNSNQGLAAGRHKTQEQQHCGGAGGDYNKNAGSACTRKSLNPILSVPSGGTGVGGMSTTTPLECSMSIQGQQKNQAGQQHLQRLLQYKVIPVKNSIVLHSSKASTDLTARSGQDKFDEQHQQQYPDQQKQKKQRNEQECKQESSFTAGSGDESEWEVHKSMIKIRSTNEMSKQHGAASQQPSLLSSARSTMSHQKAPYHTNCKTFTISRESLPKANMPVISTGLENRNRSRKNCAGRMLSPDEDGGTGTRSLDRQYHYSRNHQGEIEVNYLSSNDEDVGDAQEKNAVVDECEKSQAEYTSTEENEDDDSSCYSEDCN